MLSCERLTKEEASLGLAIQSGWLGTYSKDDTLSSIQPPATPGTMVPNSWQGFVMSNPKWNDMHALIEGTRNV
jgi:hypothetical protein